MSIGRARELRFNMTDAERALWRVLRSRQMEGLRFRRQFHVGHYIADFACPELRLVIEVDGGQHADSTYDAARDTWLENAGWTVLRFWNNEVLQNLSGVGATIRQWVTGAESRIRKNPLPDPPP